MESAPAVDYFSTLNYKLLKSDIGCYIKLDVTPIVRCWQCTPGVKSITLSSNSIINRAPLVTIASTNSCNPPVLAVVPEKPCNPILAAMDVIHSLVHTLNAALALVLVQQDQTEAVHALLQTLILL